MVPHPLPQFPLSTDVSTGDVKNETELPPGVGVAKDVVVAARRKGAMGGD